MARTNAELPPGTRISDYLSLGVWAARFTLPQVKAMLATAQIDAAVPPSAEEGLPGGGVGRKSCQGEGFAVAASDARAE